MLFMDLKKENMQAMKDHDTLKKGILPVVISKCVELDIDLKVKGASLQDDDVINVISKTIKELQDEALIFKNASRIEKYEELMKQKEYLETFLPHQLTIDEIRAIIQTLDDKTLPSVMKHFKANYNGKCDMKLVNAIACGN